MYNTINRYVINIHLQILNMSPWTHVALSKFSSSLSGNSVLTGIVFVKMPSDHFQKYINHSKTKAKSKKHFS